MSKNDKPIEISDAEIEKVAGGTDSKPAPPPPPPTHSTGSQSTGAGAGKVTFNPF